jgi:hypothetical protein
MEVIDELEDELFVPEVRRCINMSDIPPQLRSLFVSKYFSELRYQMLVTEMEMSSLDPVKDAVPNVFDHLYKWVHKIENDYEDSMKEGLLLLDELKQLKLERVVKSLEKLLQGLQEVAV